MFNKLERVFIEQHHALQTSAIEVEFKRAGDTGLSESNCMEGLLKAIEESDNDKIAKNLAGLFDANNDPKVAILDKVDFLSKAIENHLLFCEEFLKNKQIIITKEIGKKIVDEIIKNHSEPIKMQDVQSKKLYDKTMLGVVKARLMIYIQEPEEGQKDGAASPSAGSSPSSTGSSPLQPTKGKIKIVGIHRAIANRISGKNTQQVIQYLTEIGVVNGNNTVDIEKKIAEIDAENDLYRDSGLSLEFVKQIKSIKVMELIDETIKNDKPCKFFTKNDINNYIPTLQEPDEEKIRAEKTEERKKSTRKNANRGIDFYTLLSRKEDKTIRELIDENTSFKDEWKNLLGLMRMTQDNQQQFNLPDNSPKSKKSKPASNDEILDKTIKKAIEDLKIVIHTTGNNPKSDKIVGKIGEVLAKIDELEVPRNEIESAMQQMTRKYAGQQNLTFNNSSNLRKFIHATLLDPQLKFYIYNDPNSTSLNKFLDIIGVRL